MRGEREKKERVNEYLGNGRPCWATTMVYEVERLTSSVASVCGESTNAPRWRASSLRQTRRPSASKMYKEMKPSALDAAAKGVGLDLMMACSGVAKCRLRRTQTVSLVADERAYCGLWANEPGVLIAGSVQEKWWSWRWRKRPGFQFR